MTSTPPPERYELLELIGQGTQARVFRARDRQLARDVAVKVFTDLADEDARRRFERECRVLSALSHPAIVPLFDWGILPTGSLFYVMAHDPAAVTLLAWLQARPAPRDRPPADVLSVVGDLAGALDHIHARGLCHRDLKPSNILVHPPARARLMDFGSVRDPTDAAGRLTRTGDLVGTMAYFSPEQAQGRGVTPRSDIYQLGLILYEMVTGAPAVSDPAGYVRRLSEGRLPFPAPSARVPEIDPELEDLLLRATDPDPGRRFASAAELAAGLAAIPGERWFGGGRTGDATWSTLPVPDPANPPARDDSGAPGGSAGPRSCPPVVAGVSDGGSPDRRPRELAGWRRPGPALAGTFLVALFLLGGVVIVLRPMLHAPGVAVPSITPLPVVPSPEGPRETLADAPADAPRPAGSPASAWTPDAGTGVTPVTRLTSGFHEAHQIVLLLVDPDRPRDASLATRPLDLVPAPPPGSARSGGAGPRGPARLTGRVRLGPLRAGSGVEIHVRASLPAGSTMEVLLDDRHRFSIVRPGVPDDPPGPADLYTTFDPGWLHEGENRIEIRPVGAPAGTSPAGVAPGGAITVEPPGFDLRLRTGGPSGRP